MEAEANAIRARTRKLIEETKRLLLEISANRAAYQKYLKNSELKTKERPPKKASQLDARSRPDGKRKAKIKASKVQVNRQGVKR